MKKSIKTSSIIDPNLKRLIEDCLTLFTPDKIVLFGSRARGDHLPKSDYDLAFFIDNKELDGWEQFYNKVTDSPPSLHNYDMVLYEQVDEALKASIDGEGVVIYERKEN